MNSASEQIIDRSKSVFDIEKVMSAAIPVGIGVTDELLEWRQSQVILDTETGPSFYYAPRNVSPETRLGALDEWLQRVRATEIVEKERPALASAERETISQATSFEPLQEWEGYITAIRADEFSARLVDVTANENAESEETEISFDDVSESDRELLVLGAVFRWMIGYQRTASGTRRKVSSVVFRRLPIWLANDIEQSREKAKQVISAISWK